MKNDIKFYNQPGADREDWYRLVIPDDEADPFIEHTWTYHNADGSMEMNSGRACIPISDFLSKEYPKEAKTHFRKLLATIAAGKILSLLRTGIGFLVLDAIFYFAK